MSRRRRELVEQRARSVRKRLLRVLNGANWADVGWDGSLCGACAVAAYLLYRELRDLGLPAQFCGWNDADESHCFVMVDDVVVDCTATQYSRYPVVVLGTHQELRERYRTIDLWRPEFRYRDEEEILRELEGWPEEQHPLRLAELELI